MSAARWFPFATREAHLESAGINEAWWITHKLYAKTNSTKSPYLIPNEWICGQIAQFLRLPIPPFALMRQPRKRGMFASLRFGTRDTVPNDADPAKCWAADPALCSGIVLFDVLIANDDRHQRNLGVDDPTAPKAILIFDHERAMLGARARAGRARLRQLRNRVQIHHHCLARLVDTARYLGHWIERIRSLPTWYVREACRDVLRMGISASLENEICDFFRYRRDEIEKLVLSNKHWFPRVNDWGLTL